MTTSYLLFSTFYNHLYDYISYFYITKVTKKIGEITRPASRDDLGSTINT